MPLAINQLQCIAVGSVHGFEDAILCEETELILFGQSRYKPRKPSGPRKQARSSLIDFYRALFPFASDIDMNWFLHNYPPLSLSHASFQTHAQQLLRLDGEFHGQLAENGFTEAIHNHAHRVFQ